MLRRLCALAVLGRAALLAVTPAAPVFNLPDDVTPIRYSMEVTIDPNRDMFDGFARIEVNLRKPRSTVWLNAKDLTIESASVSQAGRQQEVRAEEAGGEFLGLTAVNPIRPGSAVLLIHYRGHLHEKPVVGPYRIQFENNWYVFTTFTPIDARRAFPCFDEPRFKTPWQLTIHVKREHSGFSNAPAIQEVDEPNGMKAIHFADTQPLPAEVVAFAVGPLETLDGGTAGSGHVPVRVIAPKGLAAEGAEAARATADVMRKLEAYTAIPYPYAKLDHVALPQGAFGAVENPGLITYRLNALLVPPGAATPQKLRGIRSIEAHEMAHQWFGDLVTQAAWEDVWLSEGFATWLSQKVMGEDEPPTSRNLAAVAARERIMLADQGPKTHAVRLTMQDRASMNTVYNQFVYQKGSAVLLMLENWLSEERFRDGLRSYLKQHRFDRATTADLAAALRETTGTDPTAVMHFFLDQPGVPEVEAHVNCHRGSPPTITFQQTSAKIWAVPVCWRAVGQPATCFVLDTAQRAVSLASAASCPAFVLPNAGATGYYRSIWTGDQLTALVKEGIDDLTPAERLNLTHDLAFLEKTGRLTGTAVEQALKKLAADAIPEIARASDEALIQSELLNAFSYRNLGPFRAGGWVSAVAVPDIPTDAHLHTIYAAVRNGGVWKSTNAGTTFAPIFDKQDVSSIGAIAVAPSDQNVVWVGTGDASLTRSALPGNGAYKSVDAGKSWQHMGLRDTQHISRIVIDPANSDIVYIAAAGHLFTPNSERGVFKTVDGGNTWTKVLYVGDTAGAIDLVQDHKNPNTLYAALYEGRRFPWRLMDGGPKSGIYKTTDGGVTWKKLESGLPIGQIGRIGIDLSRSHSNILYAVLDNNNARSATEQEIRQDALRQRPQQPRTVGGEVYRSDDAGLTWRKTSAPADDVSRKSGYAFNQIRIDPDNPDHIFITGSNLIESRDSGKTWIGLGFTPPASAGPDPATNPRPMEERPFRRAFGDFRSFWIDPHDAKRMIATSDGGVFISYDGGKTCDHVESLQLGEVYGIAVDMDQPYNIYAGLQDHENWKGPINGKSGSVGIEDWTTTGTGDGMFNQVDPADSRWLYNTQEFGSLHRVDQKLHTRKLIAPKPADGGGPLRFNWVAPVHLSPHNSQVLYTGAHLLFQSVDRGDHWRPISPDLTTNDASKITLYGGSIQYCTITTISESPVKAGVIWVGTDDGKVQVTRDSGATWVDATPAVKRAGGPEDAWLTRVLASKFEAGSAYITKSRNRQDDFQPYVFKTTDFGVTWTPIMGNLPMHAVNVIVEDPVNPSLLFVGNDSGVFVSINGGQRWRPLNGSMPPVPVFDLVIHPREGDLLAGTFGRGIWVTNIRTLRELTDEVLNQDVHFFTVKPFAERHEGAWGNYRLYGDRYPVTPNEPNGPILVYYLKARTSDKTFITINDAKGALVKTLPASSKGGLNQLVWPLDTALPGEYEAILHVGERTLSRKVQVMSRAPQDEPRYRPLTR